jgi:hypothetical protein
MEKTLRFKIDGKEYKLAYTRETVIETENMGFNLANFTDKPIASLTYLWRGAFLANHGTLTYAEMDALLEKVKHKGLLDALIDLYNAPIISLMDEENEKNAVEWTVD